MAKRMFVGGTCSQCSNNTYTKESYRTSLPGRTFIITQAKCTQCGYEIPIQERTVFKMKLIRKRGDHHGHIKEDT
jgi:hypothetical protein